MHVLFADSAPGVRRAQEILGAEPAAVLVALTAEALEHAAARHVPCRAVSEIVTGGRAMLAGQRDVLRAWIAAMREFEETLGAGLPDCRFEGPGVLLSRVYLVSFAVNAVRCRAGLMIHAAAQLQARKVTVLETVRDAGFRGDGYETNPWTLAFSAWAGRENVRMDVVGIAPPAATR